MTWRQAPWCQTGGRWIPEVCGAMHGAMPACSVAVLSAPRANLFQKKSFRSLAS